MSDLTFLFILNSKHNERGAVKMTLPTTGIYNHLANRGKQKLKMKKTATIIYLSTGFALSAALTDDRIAGKIGEMAASSHTQVELYFSMGEPYTGMVASTPSEASGRYRIIADSSPVDAEAWKQLKATAGLKGMLLSVGMPDLHAGGKFPIGATFITDGLFYPALIGGDIGCGMSLYSLPLPSKSADRPQQLAAKLTNIEGPFPFPNDEAREALLSEFKVKAHLPGGTAFSTMFDDLGTIGRGNHFAEILRVVEVRDADTAEALGLDSEKLVLLVHSGSRSLGQHVLDTVPKALKNLSAGTEEADDYLELHDQALNWARANRALIARRVMDALAGDVTRHAVKILDVWHNFVEKRTVDAAAWQGSGQRDVYIHRKGAASTFDGAVVIPGSRGARSYVVLPTGDCLNNAFSLAHGAGRSMARTTAKAEFSKPFYKGKLHTTVFGSQVICEDLNLLYEEAPDAYKEVDLVIEDLVNAGACSVIAVMEPVVTYKCRKA